MNKNEAALTNCNKVEVLLQSAHKIEFPKTMSLLMDPNVLVADTGASVDSAGHKMGIYNIKMPDNGEGVT